MLSHVGIFDPSCELLPLCLLSDSFTPPSLPKVNVQYIYIDSVWLEGGGGMLSCVVDHILHEFNTLFLTRFRTYKIATPPQTKTLVYTTLRDLCIYSSCVHAPNLRIYIQACINMHLCPMPPPACECHRSKKCAVKHKQYQDPSKKSHIVYLPLPINPAYCGGASIPRNPGTV
jgi:hypothetical protein